MSLVDSNTYIEPTAGTSLNAARSQYNNSLRSLLTNFRSSAVPDTLNLTASGSGIGEQDGMLFRMANSNVNALYISDSTTVKDAPVGGNFTRVGIGNRIENGIVSLMSNVTHYEIGELVATTSADVSLASNARLYLNIANNQTSADFIDVGIPPTNGSVVNTMIAVGGISIDRVNFAKPSFTHDSFNGVTNWWANTTLKVSATAANNTSIGLGTLNSSNVALVHRRDVSANSALNGLHVMSSPGTYANVAVAGIAVNSITDSPTSAPAPLVPAGTVMMWTNSTAPSGWLLCHGQAISRTTYKALFAAAGTSFGTGDGSTTFNIPDMRERAPYGPDTTALGADSGTFAGNYTRTSGSTVAPVSTGSIVVSVSAKDAGGTTVLNSATGGAHTHTYSLPGVSIEFIIKT